MRLRSLFQLFLLLTLQLPFAVASDRPGKALGFDEAWQQALLRSDFLAAEHSNSERARLLHEATRGLYFPRIDLAGSYTRLDGPVTLDGLAFNPLSGLADDPLGSGLIDLLGGPENFRTDLTDEHFGRVALSAVWPIYTGGRITAIRNSREAESLVANALLDAQRRILFEELVRAYFGVSLAKVNLAIRREAEEGLQKHLSNADKLLREGQIARVERLSVAAALSRAEVAYLRAERELEIGRLTLNEILHENSAVEPSDALFINQALPAEATFVQSMLANNPALLELQARGQEAESLLSAQKGRFHPEVFAYADYELYKDDNIAFDLVPDWQVGIGVSFTLLDRIGRNRSIDAAHHAQEAVGHLERGARRILTLAAGIAYREAEQAIAEYQGLESSLALARENLHLREKAFTQGLSTSVELVDAQLFLSAVSIEQSLAAYRFVTALSRLLALGGEMERFGNYQSTAWRAPESGMDIK